MRGELTGKPLPAGDTSETGQDGLKNDAVSAGNPVAKGGFQGAGTGLSGFFPRVLNPVSFPVPGVDTTGDPVGP